MKGEAGRLRVWKGRGHRAGPESGPGEDGSEDTGGKSHLVCCCAEALMGPKTPGGRQREEMREGRRGGAFGAALNHLGEFGHAAISSPDVKAQQRGKLYSGQKSYTIPQSSERTRPRDGARPAEHQGRESNPLTDDRVVWAPVPLQHSLPLSQTG